MSENEHTERATPDGGTRGRQAEQSTDGDRPGGGDDALDVSTVEGTTASLPDTEDIEAALDGDATPTETTEESVGTAVEEEPTAGEVDRRVLEFVLDDERYCLDIDYIEEIVEVSSVTRVPNTPAIIEGVVDLRGQITTILNPKIALETTDREAGDLIVVFDADALDEQGHVGWVVDGVRQVSPLSDDQVSDPPGDEEFVNGIIERETEEFVVWITPDLGRRDADAAG